MKTKLISAGTLFFTLFVSSIASAQTNIFPASGNTGIGTLSPVEKLDVRGNIKISDYTLYFRGGTDNNHGVGYRGITPFAGQTIDGPVVFGWNGGGLGSTNTIGGGPKLAVRWNEKGYVGLGTNNPLEALQIGDRFTFHSGGFKGMCYNFMYDSGDKRIVSDYASGIFFTNSGTILFRTAVSGTAGSAISWLNNITINNDGKVMIGSVTTPGNYKLYVQQGILTDKVKVAVNTTSEWSDYVFADSYQLKSISELEAFVKANKHLPNVPSAEEVVKEGIDLAKMDAKLLEKIEELSLYIIELKKETIEIKKENTDLLKRIEKIENK